MPLIDFRTNLTSLKFGTPTTGDQPGGGYSGQPFVEFPIDNGNVPEPYQTYYAANRYGLDYPIRGGSITSLVDSFNTTISATIDTQRISAFFKSKPRGTAFIEKQKNLQSTNPRTQVEQVLALTGTTLNNAVLPVTQVYNEANTLAQIGVGSTGLHFNRHGVSPTIYENLKQTYEYIAGAPENNEEGTNRLTILKALKLASTLDFIIDPNTATQATVDLGLLDRMGISTIRNQLFNYPGGPGSTYGIGFTRIFRVVDTEPKTEPVTGRAYSTIGMTYKQLAEQKTINNSKLNAYPQIQDYRAQLGGQHAKFAVDQSVENRLKIGTPGNSQVNKEKYTNSSLFGQDRVNQKNPFIFNPSSQTPWEVGGEEDTTDIIKFMFECLDNDDLNNSVALVFRAFLEGSITDNNTAEYNTFKYLGRGETFRTYQGFNRSISFTFKIAAQSRQEMQPLYSKLNYLISQVYPDYSPGTNIMRGNVVNLTIGDYLYRTPGFLESVNVTIDNNNTPWEIVLNPQIETDMRQLPHFVTVACTFYPIMNILPQKQKPTNYTPLIVNTVNRFLVTGSA